MADLTDAAIAEIAGRADAATDGPWKHGCLPGIDPRSNRVFATSVRDEERGHPWTTVLDADMEFDDAVFVAHARTDVPALAEALREARDENARLRGRVVALEGSWDEVARQRDEWIEIAQFNARAALEEGER